MTRRRVWSVVLLAVSVVVLVLHHALDLFAVPRGSDDADVLGALIQYLAFTGVLLGIALARRPTTVIRHDGHRQRRGRLLLGLGAATTTCYLVLGAVGTGIGAPADIGGGLILLAGYALTAAGIFTAVDHPGASPRT